MNSQNVQSQAVYTNWADVEVDLHKHNSDMTAPSTFLQPYIPVVIKQTITSYTELIAVNITNAMCCKKILHVPCYMKL